MSGVLEEAGKLALGAALGVATDIVAGRITNPTDAAKEMALRAIAEGASADELRDFLSDPDRIAGELGYLAARRAKFGV